MEDKGPWNNTSALAHCMKGLSFGLLEVTAPTDLGIINEVWDLYFL